MCQRLFWGLLFSFLGGLAFAEEVEDMKHPDQEALSTLLIFGDSLSAAHGLDPEQGWVSLLEKRLKEQDCAWKVVNISVSGETTAGGLSRLPLALKRHHPQLVVLELGANDGLRGLNLEAMRGNLKQMIDLSREAGAEVLLLGMKLPTNFGPLYTESFHQVYAELAQTHHLPWVNFLLEGVARDDKYVQADGLHPTAEAQGKILDNVWSELSPLLKNCQGM